MTRPEPIGLVGQRDLHRKITDLLVLRAPSDWQQLRVNYRAAGDHVEQRGKVLGIDGQLRDWNPPAECQELFEQLRAGMYKPGAGTWTGAQVIVEFPIRSTISYQFDDPGWQTPPPRTAILDELERFPRDPASVPAWMRALMPDVDRLVEVAGRFRHARIFDVRDPRGRPVVNRPPVPEAEVPGVLNYLNTAPVLRGGRGFDADLFDPDSAPDVPAAFHTDGTWIWPAAVPHYLAKHGVPPEPDLVEHIRAAGFTPPPVDADTRSAAYTALTGEVPPPKPQAAPAPVADLSDLDRWAMDTLRRRLADAGVNTRAYSIGEPHDETWTLLKTPDGWQVGWAERGLLHQVTTFARVQDAAERLLGALLFLPSRYRLADINTREAVNDWPIQPLAGEPPLTLLRYKRVVALPVGTALARYGPPTGNLVTEAGTEFSALSLRPERAADGPHLYTVRRELWVLTGEVVPWHNQPGGGTAYFLPLPVAGHLANGSLTADPDPEGSATSTATETPRSAP
jgi:hypothetical protein